MASIIATSPSQARRAGYGPGPATDLMPARGRRRCLLIRTTAGGSSSARPQMTSRRGPKDIGWQDAGLHVVTGTGAGPAARRRAGPARYPTTRF